MATQEERSVFLKSPIQEELCQSLIRSWIEEGRGRLGLVVVGEAGQGKSSLNNGLLGKQVATEAWSLDQETPIVEKYSYFENGIAVTLLDTPGFGVDKLSDEETLQEMVKQFSGEDSVDLMLYCIRMDGTRWPKTTDKKTIDKMTKFFSPKIWQCCQFVLTFANQVVGLCPPEEEQEGFFTYKVRQYEEKVRKTLIEYAHLTEEEVKQIRVVPVGYPYQYQNESWELPGIDDWFLNFWLECTCSIRQSALPSLIKLNRHRINDMPEDISSPNPPALYQHHVPSYAAELPEPAAGTSSEPQYAGLEAPDQCEPASNEPSPMPSLTQSHDNSSINIDQVESQQLTAPPTIDDGAESPQLASNQATENPTNGLESHPISLYRILQNLLKNEKSGFLQYITTYLNKRGNQVPVFGYFEGVIEGLISWLGREPTTAVRKMPQHQLLAEDIQENFLEQDIVYSASTFTQKVKTDEQLWILAVSKNLDTMKQYLTSSLKEAEQEIEEVTFEFEKEELTLEILDEVTPGWIIEPLTTPCTITRQQVDSCVQPHNIEHEPIVCKVRIAFENPSRPPDEVLRNRIRLDGIRPERCFYIHFMPPLLRTDSDGSTSRRACSFDSPPSLDSVVPTQRDFYKMVILKIPTKWKTFGIMLDIDIERLEGILQDKKSSEDCFLEVYRIGMMELDQQFTWERVLDILYDLNENSLRNKIVDKLQDKILDSVEDEMLTQYKSNEERRQIIQKESEVCLKELYNQFFRPVFESLCNEQVYSSLIDQLVSMSLISEADKETLLSSTQHPKVWASSLLEVLNIEEKPHLLMELIKAMEEVEMLTQYRANEAGKDVSKKIERQLTGINVVDERVFKLEGRKAQPLLWEEHGFRMFIPEDALLPYETCHVSVKAIVSGRFQFPEGTEPVSAVYAISLSRQLRKPARMEMQHCVKLENPEHSKSMSFAVASQDPSSMLYQFHEVPGGFFEENKFFGSVDCHQFFFMTIIWKLLGYDIKCIYSASTFTQKVKMNEQLWILAVSKNLDTMKWYLTSSLKEAEQEIEEVTFEFEKEKLTLEILDKATPGWIIEPLTTPCTITRRQVESYVQPHNIEHGPIVCKVRIAFEKLSKPPDEVLRNRIRLDGIRPERCFNIHFKPPLLQTDSDELDGKHKVVKVLTRQNEDLQQQVEQKNIRIIQLQKRVITLEESTTSSLSDLDKLTTTSELMKTYGKDTAVQTSISLPSSQLVGMRVVAEQVFEVQGGSAQSLLWEEHGFRMHIPQDALLPNETCLVSVKAIVAGLFQFPEGTERVSAVYAISSSLPFNKPVMTELQHCVQLDNSEQGKYMSFAVAQHDPSSICYQFQPLAGGLFQANSHYGILERDHFCILTILKYLAIAFGYVVDDSESEKSAEDDQAEMGDEHVEADKRSEESVATGSEEACPGHVSSVEVPCNVYRLMTFYEKQESWIIAVSQKYNTIEEHVKNCINSGIPEVKMHFCFKEKEEECLEIAVKPEATDDGWIIRPPLYPCMIDKKEVDSQDANAKYHPVLRKVRVSIADYSNPPTTTLDRSVPLYGTKKPNQILGFTFKPPDTRRRDSAESIQSLPEFPTLSPTIRPKQDDTPERPMFFKMVVKKIPDKWWDFGIMVLSDISTGQLKAVERECNNKQEKCFIEIYNLCISQLPQFTWKTVLRALKDIGENTLYRDLIGHLDI